MNKLNKEESRRTVDREAETVVLQRATFSHGEKDEGDTHGRKGNQESEKPQQKVEEGRKQ